MVDHLDTFVDSYNRLYQSKYGKFRPIIEKTIHAFIECGDPRYGVAVYKCDHCGKRLVVPFSCKTRLFCSSCHSKSNAIWVAHLIDNVFADVSHRFWTFSIPKLLRPFFLRNRKLISLLVKAANQTICLALGDGKVQSGIRPGIIALIQTHGDQLNFHPHLHMIVSDGVFDYRDVNNITYHPCFTWNTSIMKEIFRRTLLELLYKQRVITDALANNLMSWRNSGFYVHKTDPFDITDKDGLIARLSYASRPPVATSRLSYKNNTVYYKSKQGQVITFAPLDYIATITAHIPDHYQNIRRYLGYYASNVQRCLPKNKDLSNESVNDTAIHIGWAKLIAKIFGELPTICPNCGSEMVLDKFMLHTESILHLIPWMNRSPPKKIFTPFSTINDNTTYEPEYEQIDFFENSVC